MSHFISKLSEILHFHPLAHHPVASGSRPFRDAFGFIDASSRATTTAPASLKDDLAFLALSVEYRASSARGSLGQFALLSGDESGKARVESIWCSLD